MKVARIESLIDGGSRVVARFPDGRAREFGLSKKRREAEQPCEGMGLAVDANGHLHFYPSVQAAIDSEETDAT